MNATSYRDLELKVMEWAGARKIIPNSTPIAQARKAGEEVIELVEAAARMKALNDVLKLLPALEDNDEFQSLRLKARNDFDDAVGDTVVCLINSCALADSDLVICLAGAYEQIKDRRGTMRPDGIFVKESTG